MMSSTFSQNKKNLNVELNLMPVFDVLSVCICFLLMTIVWVQVTGLKTSQTYGDSTLNSDKPHPSLWISMGENNDLELSVKQSDKIRSITVVNNIKGAVDWTTLNQKLKEMSPQNYQDAVILPSKKTKYESVVQFMDAVKLAGIKDVGISPY